MHWFNVKQNSKQFYIMEFVWIHVNSRSLCCSVPIDCNTVLQFGMFETMTSGFVDEFPKFLKGRKMQFTALMCFAEFLLGIPIVTQVSLFYCTCITSFIIRQWVVLQAYTIITHTHLSSVELWAYSSNI